MIDRIRQHRIPRHYIQEWMEAKGVDSRRLADRMDRSEATVSKLLNGRMKMTLEYLAEFAHHLDVDVPQLFRHPDAPTRDELLRGYSNEELTSAIQLIQRARDATSRPQDDVLDSDSDADQPRRNVGTRR